MPKTYHGRFHLDLWEELSDAFFVPLNDANEYFKFEFFKPIVKYIPQNKLITAITFAWDTYQSDVRMVIYFEDSTRVYVNDLRGFEDEQNNFDVIPPFDWYGTISDWGDAPDIMYNALLNNGAGEQIIFPSENVIFCYTLNSDKHTVDKSLTPIRTYIGNFNQPVTLRDFILPIDLSDESFMIDFNYVFINQLNRYYYVRETTYAKNFVNLMLHEDVLYTFRDLIREQTAFVERNENDYSNFIVDDLITMDYNKEISFIDVTDSLALFEYPRIIYDVDGDVITSNAISDNTDYRYVLTVINAV